MWVYQLVVIGSAAQHKLMKYVSGSLKLELAQYREILQEFERFGFRFRMRLLNNY